MLTCREGWRIACVRGVPVEDVRSAVEGHMMTQRTNGLAREML